MEFDGRAHTQNEIATRLEMVLRFLTDQMWPFKDLDSIEYSTLFPSIVFLRFDIFSDEI